jgi:hypothetical protein
MIPRPSRNAKPAARCETRGAAQERPAASLHITRDQGVFGSVPHNALPDRVGGRLMRGEIYRVVYWVGIAALVVWTVYSAYSAFSFS